MIKFTGILQVKSILKEMKSPFGLPAKLVEAISSRGPTIPYDGSTPFDLFHITIFSSHKKDQLLDLIKPGDIIWIESGLVRSSCYKGSSKLFWNILLRVPSDSVKILGNESIGPDHDEHINFVGTNEKPHIQ